MKRNKKILYRMMSRWSIGYILITTIAIIFFAFGMKEYSDVLRDEVTHSNAVIMETVQIRMDRKIKELRSLCSKVILNPTVGKLRRESSYKNVSPYELYEVVQELSDEIDSQDGASSCYLYFPDIDFMISGTYYNSSRDFYEIALKEDHGFGYEEWSAIISGSYHKTQLFTLTGKDGGKKTAIVKPIDSRGGHTGAVNAVMLVDFDQVMGKDFFRNEYTDENDTVCIIDRENGKVISSREIDEKTLDYLLENEWSQDEGSLNAKPKSGFSVLSYIHSEYENWDYGVLASAQESIRQINNLQNLVMILILCYLLVSAGIILYTMFLHVKPLNRLVDTLSSQMGADRTYEISDAYEFINRSVDELMAKNKSSISVIQSQKNAIGRELLRRLVTTRAERDLPDSGLLCQYGIDIRGKSSMVLAYEIDEEATDFGELVTGEADPKKLAWFILGNVTDENLDGAGFVSMHFEKDNRIIFLILSDKDDQGTADQVKAAVQSSSEFIVSRCRIHYHIALSEVQHSAAGINAGFRQIKSVFDYQKNTAYNGVYSYGEINILPGATMLKYPLETENRLSGCICTNRPQEAYELVMGLLKDNRDYCILPETMKFLISNIISTIIRATVKAARGEHAAFSAKNLMDACDENDWKRICRELKLIIDSACSQAYEAGRPDKGDRKAHLCQLVKQFVEENYSDSGLGVNEIAAQFDMQQTYLSRMFKDKERENLSQYIHNVRMKHVKELLMEDGMKLEEIAVRCGYGSQRTFLRIFKTYVGVTPSQYREIEEKKREEERKS